MILCAPCAAKVTGLPTKWTPFSSRPAFTSQDFLCSFLKLGGHIFAQSISLFLTGGNEGWGGGAALWVPLAVASVSLSSAHPVALHVTPGQGPKHVSTIATVHCLQGLQGNSSKSHH